LAFVVCSNLIDISGSIWTICNGKKGKFDRGRTFCNPSSHKNKGKGKAKLKGAVGGWFGNVATAGHK